MVIEQPPLEWAGFLGALAQWLQEFGRWALVWLFIMALTYFTYPELRHRVKWGARYTGMVALGCISVAAFILFFILLLSQGRIQDTTTLRITEVGRGANQPVYMYTSQQSMALTAAGLAAVLACLVPIFFDLIERRLIFRRIWAIAKLSLKEAWSRGIVWVCLIVPLIYLYADWYISAHAEDQLRTRVSIAYFSMTILFLVTSALLGAFSIPADIMNQNIFTIVTKPVERYEIVLGRFLGYGLLIFAEVLVLTGISCLYIGRGLTEQAKEESYHARVPLYGSELYFFNTSKRNEGTNVGREWQYRTYITGINPQLANQKVQYAIWRIDNIPSPLLTRTPDEDVSVEFTFDIFRTTIGQEGKGVNCSFTFARGNLKPEDVDNLLKPGGSYEIAKDKMFKEARVASDPAKNALILNDIAWKLFEKFGVYRVQGVSVKDYHIQKITVPAKVIQACHDNIKNYVAGEVDVTGNALPEMLITVNVENDRFSRLQLVGMAKFDLYILVEDREFFVNFFKGSLCIYLMACIVLGLSVVASTYLSGIISLLFTTFLCIGGLFLPFVRSMAEGKSNFGGPAESMYRLLSKTPGSLALDQQSATVSGVMRFDVAFQWGIQAVLNVLPDVGYFYPKDYVANGFDLTWSTLLLLNHILPTLAYIGPWIVLAYYLMKSREIANP